MDWLAKSKAYPCGICSLRVKANSVFYVWYGNWIHGRAEESGRYHGF